MGLESVRVLLESLTIQIPLPNKARHNITFVEGNLHINLIIGNKWLSVRLENSDYEKPIDDLVSEIVGFADDFIKGNL